MKFSYETMKQRRSIHRILVTRLVIVALVLSAILSTLVFFHKLDTVDKEAIERATEGAEKFRWLIIEHLDAPGFGDHDRLQKTMQKPSSEGLKSGDGYFVLARILDLDFREIAKTTDQSYPHITLVTDSADKDLDRSSLVRDGIWHRMIRLEKGVVVILLGVELRNSLNRRVGYIEGSFAVSPEVIAAAWRDVLFITLVVFAAVLLTTTLLYPVILQLLRRVTALSGSLLHANMEILNVLGSAVAKRDSDTDTHNYRVTLYAVHLARELRLDDDEIRTLLKGAFLHDVGKIGVSDTILLKPGKLTPGEFEEMKKHVRYGVDILSRSSWLSDALHVVGSHHEKYDGSGYDRHRNYEDIPRVARIFAIADVFDALTSKRPYKEPHGYEESMQILMESRGNHFDPEILDVFAGIARSLYDEYANRDDDKLRNDLKKINEQYYHRDLVSYIH